MGNNTEDKGLFIISEYLDDYFAECEEHITAVKRHVVSLDPSKKTEKKIIDELLRSFHTIKGLSGMVGFEEAEMLSHSMEDYFKAIRDEKITLSRDAIDNIIEGVKKLEFILAERKEGRPASGIKAFNERLKNLIEDKKIETEKEKKPVEQDTAQLNEDVLSKIKEEIKKKRQIWQFYFSPSNELVNRGINVGVIRTRLSELGEIIYAAPRILEDGGVVFEFIVATDSDESAFLS
ncbi:MAG TPA: Hpt domain-containing protein [Syntrophorhabdaceae bacterium]|nr:Hpt domain-containing protein [Syntrophorhabdaceae bacterium]